MSTPTRFRQPAGSPGWTADTRPAPTCGATRPGPSRPDMTPPLVVVHQDASLLARAVAARLVTALVDAQAARGQASVVLTGGGIGIATLRELAVSPARDAIAWDALDVWWGDERFLPAGHPERNETQAREALLDAVDVEANRVHPMAPSDGPDGDDIDAAAARYAGQLSTAAHP